MSNQSFFALIQDRYPADRDRAFIETADGRRISYADLDAASARYARALDRLGLRKGDRVAFQVEKSPEVLFLYLACLRAGCVALPMNPAYRAGEVGYMLGNAEPALFVTDPRRVEELGEAARQAGVREILTLDADGRGSLADAAAREPAEREPELLTRDDLGAMLYTSGTTGRSKGAMLSHGNLASNAARPRRGLGLHGRRRAAARAADLPRPRPVRRLPLRADGRGPMIWLPRFDADAGAAACCRAATVMMGVPTFYTRLLDEPGFSREHRPATCACSSPARRRCSPRPSASSRRAPASASSSATA